MLKIRKLTRSGMDIEITTVRGVSLRIFERPGLWMEERARQDLLAELRDVATRATGGLPLEYGVLSGSRERWDRTILSVLREVATGRAIGFSAMSLLDVTVGGRSREVLHLGLLVVDPEYRGWGFSRLVCGTSCLLAFLRRGPRSLWVSNVSQVPAVLGLVAKTLKSVYPAPGARATAEHLDVARQIMVRHRAVFGVSDDAGFDEERFVITDAYTGGSDSLKKSYLEAPKSRHSDVNTWCRQELDYERGDDFLQLARYTPRVALSFGWRFLKESSGLGLFVQRVGKWFGSSLPAEQQIALPQTVAAKRGQR